MQDPDRKPRKRNRLPVSAYSEPASVWHVIINVREPNKLPLQAPKAASSVANVLNGSHSYTGAPVHLYTILPDHAHLLIEVRERNLVDIVQSIKSLTTRAWWKTGGKGPLWQRSFYHHGIRGKRDYDATVDYILDNPVNAGLVPEWDLYLYTGGSILQDQDH